MRCVSFLPHRKSKLGSAHRPPRSFSIPPSLPQSPSRRRMHTLQNAQIPQGRMLFVLNREKTSTRQNTSARKEQRLSSQSAAFARKVQQTRRLRGAPPPWGATVNSKQTINRKENTKFLIFLLFTVYCCPPWGGCIRFVINSFRICLITSVKVMQNVQSICLMI